MTNPRQWLIGLMSAAVLALVLWLANQPAAQRYTRIDGQAFATHYRITYLDGPSPASLRDAVDQELSRIDAIASTWRDDSELTRYNQAENKEAFECSTDLTALLERAEEIERMTGGAFSPRPNAQTIDLSGIAKGYAVDRVLELLKQQYGIAHCLVDIGGEVKAIGNGPKGNSWDVGLYQPSASNASKTSQIQLHDMSAATSGNYYKQDHIIDPRTGQPVRNDLHAVTVIHPSNADADALATALYVMGSELGMNWAKSHNIHAIFIHNDGKRLENNPRNP